MIFKPLKFEASLNYSTHEFYQVAENDNLLNPHKLLKRPHVSYLFRFELRYFRLFLQNLIVKSLSGEQNQLERKFFIPFVEGLDCLITS